MLHYTLEVAATDLAASWQFQSAITSMAVNDRRFRPSTAAHARAMASGSNYSSFPVVGR